LIVVKCIGHENGLSKEHIASTTNSVFDLQQYMVDLYAPFNKKCRHKPALQRT